MMDIAIPRAGHPDEQRVALTPHGVQELAAAGHTVYAVARTASHALDNALLSYIRSIADNGLERARVADPTLARGIGLLEGEPATAQVAAALADPPALRTRS